PTDVLRRPDDLKKHLDAKQLKLYTLIWRRFVASQMNPAVFETPKVDFDLGRFVFRATGSRVLFDGYHVLYHEAHEPEEGKTLEDLPPIPPLVEGDVATVRQITPTQHFTEPPPRFSEASLVKELERLGIGRPSTYATIISTLKNRWYATAKDRRFHPTPQGEIVWRVMKRCFPDVFEVGFTAQMETELDKVEEGDLGWQRVLEDFWGPFSKAHAAGAARREVPEVRRGGPGGAPHAQGTELLRMPALPRLRLLGVEPPRGDRLPELRLRGDGGEAVQGDGGHGGHAEVPEVRRRS